MMEFLMTRRARGCWPSHWHAWSQRDRSSSSGAWSKNLPIGQKKRLRDWKNNRRIWHWSCDSLSGHHLVSLNPDRHPPFIQKITENRWLLDHPPDQHVSAWSSHMKTTLLSRRDWANPDILSWLCLWQNCRATPQTRSPAVWTSSYPEAN